MSDFEPAVNYVLSKEGGLSENPKDPGGITNFGISLRFLKSLPIPGNYGLQSSTINADTIRELTIDKAKSIYHGEFWSHCSFWQLTNQDVCNYIFDMAVNMGIAPAIKCAQRACWAVFGNKETLVDDGLLGEETLGFLNTQAAASQPIFSSIRSERAGDYRVIVAKHPDDVAFIGGWLNRAYAR